jgi:protein ImuA
MDLLPPAATVLPPRPGLPPVRDQPLRRVLREAPHTLHPTLWLAHQLGRQADTTCASGFAALDAQLPGGGWPRRALSELLLRQPGIGEIRLLSPCLTAVQRSGRLVMLFDPPATLSAWALAQLGFDVEQLLIINTSTAQLPPGRPKAFARALGARARSDRGLSSEALPSGDGLWALEQALKSGHVGAVLAWLPPRLRAERLRRLQLAAHAHDGPAFVLREMTAAERPTAAPLRLALRPAGADALGVRLLKRRGPPLETPLRLALPPVLSSSAREQARAGVERDAAALPGATFINLAGLL